MIRTLADPDDRQPPPLSPEAVREINNNLIEMKREEWAAWCRADAERKQPQGNKGLEKQ